MQNNEPDLVKMKHSYNNEPDLVKMKHSYYRYFIRDTQKTCRDLPEEELDKDNGRVWYIPHH